MYYVSMCVLKPLWRILFYVYMHFRQATQVTGDICDVLVLALVLRQCLGLGLGLEVWCLGHVTGREPTPGHVFVESLAEIDPRKVAELVRR